MTDLRKHVATRAQDRKASADDFLVLPPDGLPKTVYVKFVETPGGPAAGFGLTVDGQFFTEGMIWRPDHTATWALFINFEFVRGIRDVQGERILLSAPSETAQDCALAAVAGDYPFFVQLSSGELHDPKIIISPF